MGRKPDTRLDFRMYVQTDSLLFPLLTSLESDAARREVLLGLAIAQHVSIARDSPREQTRWSTANELAAAAHSRISGAVSELESALRPSAGDLAAQPVEEPTSSFLTDGTPMDFG